MLRKAVALLRQGAAKVRGDEQKSSQACMSGTSLQHKAKSSIHYKLMRQKWLRAGQPALTAWKKSAEGIVAAGETSREYHGGLTPAKA